MPKSNHDPLLLTPGPLTTSESTKKAMLRDFGSRDGEFIAMNTRVRQRLTAIAEAEDTHVCVPVQGSGTFAVEATLGTLVPKTGKILVLINGAYGKRSVKILQYMNRAHVSLESAEDQPPDLAALDQTLASDSAIGHVIAIHCETTTGILNPIADIAAITARHGRRLIIDAMSAFGAVPLSAKQTPFDAVIASSNKCLQGVPGMGFAIIQRDALNRSAGNAHSLSLDLHDQWVAMEKNSQWRFTPPTHVIAAFDAAIAEFEAEGGVPARHRRYSTNCRILVEGMRKMGLETLLPDRLQAPIIVTFRTPNDPAFRFQMFYDSLRDKGYVIYPGKLTSADTFRIGCIGNLYPDDMKGALAAIRKTLTEMGVRIGTPTAA